MLRLLSFEPLDQHCVTLNHVECILSNSRAIVAYTVIVCAVWPIHEHV